MPVSGRKALWLALFVLAGPARLPAQLPPFLEVRIAKPPTVATGDGGSFLAYEIHVTNFAQVPMTLRSVEIARSGGSGGRAVLYSLADTALWRSISRPGTSTPLADRAKIPGGARAVVWIWAPVDRQSPPASVESRLIVAQGSDTASQMLEVTSPVATEGPAIAAPLR